MQIQTQTQNEMDDNTQEDRFKSFGFIFNLVQSLCERDESS